MHSLTSRQGASSLIYRDPSNCRRDAGRNSNEVYIAEATAFNAAGTASFPGHRFLVREKGNEAVLLDDFFITTHKSIYVYDPFKDDPDGLKKLTADQMEFYNLQKNNIKFGKKYQEFTGIEWLSLYPRRHPPRHKMWPADYFGQEHVVETKETHFVEIPPKKNVGPILLGSDRVNVGVYERNWK
jgi:hypothetical protein